jgi:hypothetical protein
MSPEIQNLLDIIERRLDWGNPDQWQGRDFDKLNEQILEQTGVSLSPSTLKRIWGRAQYSHIPSGVTLDALARFAGYDSFRAFQRTGVVPTAAKTSPGKRRLSWPAVAGVSVLVVLASLIVVLAFKKQPHPIRPEAYRFSSATVLARGIPNSVIFNYDATASPTDSVFIQQSWDPRRRELVERNIHQHTSIYYRPGFFRAKLVIDSQVVQEHALMIATNGWLGMVDESPVPVYLKTEEFLFKDGMRLPFADIQKKMVVDAAHPPNVRYYNVGNFEPVPVATLSFSAQVRNDYGDGAGACRKSDVYLLTDDGYGTIRIPLSMKGCVSELAVYALDKVALGKSTDLSGFGLDSAGWAHVVCRSNGRNLQFFVNDHLAYEAPLPSQVVHVVGMEFVFQGTGSARDIQLRSGDKEIFQAFK